MRLTRHDELVEAMARANAKRYEEDVSLSVDDIWALNSKYFLEEATAALDALLEAAVRLGAGKPGRTWTVPRDNDPATHDWNAETGTPPRSHTTTPALILRMEASDD